MKNVIYLLTIALFFSCKNEVKESPLEIKKESATTSINHTATNSDQIVVTDKSAEDAEVIFKYICAENGLNVRDADNAIVGKLPNATSIIVKKYTVDEVSIEDKERTIKGRKALIDFWSKEKGQMEAYVFEGYLCDITNVKLYESELCKVFWNSKEKCLDEALKLELVSKQMYDSIPKTISNGIIDKEKYTMKDSILILPTKAEDLVIKNEIFEDKSRLYTYQGEAPALNAYVVSGEYFEAWDYAFYSKKTGREIARIEETPYFSPDKKILVGLSFNPYTDEGVVTIGSIENKTLNLKPSFLFKNWAPAPEPDIKWLEDRVFLIKVLHVNAYWNQEGSGFNENYEYLKVTVL